MKIIKAFWKPLLWSVVVLLLSAMSGEKVNEIGLLRIPHMDKVCHFGMYFTLTFLLLFDFNRYKSEKYTWLQCVIFSIAIAVVYGGSMEILQRIPQLHRSSDFHDFIANSAGAFMAVVLFKPFYFVYCRFVESFIKPKQNYSL